jgi:DNA gyrase/topoisomerase IV subunit B
MIEKKSDLSAFNRHDVTTLIVRSLVLYSLAEHQAGFANRVEVNVDGSLFSVEDDGKGHSIDKSIDDTPYLPLIYEQVNYPFGSRTTAPVQLQGIGISIINVLCESLEVTIQKKDCRLLLGFESGRLIARERQDQISKKTGNRINGSVNVAFMREPFNSSQFGFWLKEIATVAPKLELSFNRQPINT